MTRASSTDRSDPAPSLAAPQQKPRPLPLFLDLLRSETAESPQRRAAALAGLKAYQRAERTPRLAPMPVVARAGRAVLRDYGGDGPPSIFVPSLINPPEILDLAEDSSLLRWLAANGIHPLLVDWGFPQVDDDIDIAGHVETMLLPLVEAIGEPAHIVGYCLGGTMATAAAAIAPVRSLALIATPWRFSGFPDDARERLSDLWKQAEPSARMLGVLPMEVLQTAFWRLDPARTIGKFEAFSRLDPASERARAFVALEDWANDGPPLTYGAARQLLEEMFAADATGCGEWRVAGKAIDPEALACPVLDIASSTDRIVPAASAAGAGERLMLAQGHVGMVIGGRAREALWEPLRAWLSQSQHSG